MKSAIVVSFSVLLLAACAARPQGPTPFEIEMQKQQLAREQAAQAKAKLVMSDGSTYAQKTAQLDGYMASLLAQCDTRPSISNGVMESMTTAQVRLDTGAPTAPWFQDGAGNGLGRDVDCVLVHRRTPYWLDWSKQLAEYSNSSWDAVKVTLQALEHDVATVLAVSPKRK